MAGLQTVPSAAVQYDDLKLTDEVHTVDDRDDPPIDAGVRRACQEVDWSNALLAQQIVTDQSFARRLGQRYRGRIAGAAHAAPADVDSFVAEHIAVVGVHERLADVHDVKYRAGWRLGSTHVDVAACAREESLDVGENVGRHVELAAVENGGPGQERTHSFERYRVCGCLERLGTNSRRDGLDRCRGFRELADRACREAGGRIGPLGNLCVAGSDANERQRRCGNERGQPNQQDTRVEHGASPPGRTRFRVADPTLRVAGILGRTVVTPLRIRFWRAQAVAQLSP